MPDEKPQERRRYERYSTEVPTQYTVSYDFQAAVAFQVRKDQDPEHSRAQFHGETINVSAEGICLRTAYELCKRDILNLTLEKPAGQGTNVLEGRVRWSCCSRDDPKDGKNFEVGVIVTRVNGQEVEKSIIFDEIHGLYWSSLMEMAFGSINDFIKINKEPG